MAGRDTHTCTVLTVGNRKVQFPKGGKNFKGKGKEAYFMEYNPTHYVDYDMSHVYVLSSVDENHIQSISVEKAILDAGAVSSMVGPCNTPSALMTGLVSALQRDRLNEQCQSLS